jgi:hypothetical protein
MFFDAILNTLVSHQGNGNNDANEMAARKDIGGNA